MIITHCEISGRASLIVKFTHLRLMWSEFCSFLALVADYAHIFVYNTCGIKVPIVSLADAQSKY